MRTLLSLAAAWILSGLVEGTAQGQGTIRFEHPWFQNGTIYYSLYQDTNGMSFRADPYAAQPYVNMVRVGGGLAGHPNNGTPHLEFVNTLGVPRGVVFAWTDSASLGQSFLNGAPFGLVSVDLADPLAPSLAPVSITFNGFRADGSMVSQTFTTLGSGSGFQTFYFDPGFAAGLTRVEIPSAAWAMDNIVFVPEPGSASLVLVGLGALLVARRRSRLGVRTARGPGRTGQEG